MMPIHCCQHHMMWTAPSIVPMHSLGHDVQNDVQFFGHVTPLGPALTSCDAYNIFNGTMQFLDPVSQNEV